MKKNMLVMLGVSALALGMASPSLASAVQETKGLFGSNTAVVVDTPSGVVVDSVVRMPIRSSRCLATAFGDEHGFGQKVVGGTLGVPWGFVYGMPEGAIRGFRHGWVSGWDKPFSMESFNTWQVEDKK